MSDARAPMGVVLAGGLGRRMGGGKAIVLVRGRALLNHPLAALLAVLPDVAVVAKRDVELPGLDPRVAVWMEPPVPRHPLAGIVQSLRLAGGRPVFVAAGDLALLDRATVRRILAVDRGDADAVVPRVAGRLQPLCALYAPGALGRLAGFDPTVRLTDAVQGLRVRELAETDATPYFNVNTPDDLLQATAMLDRRDGFPI
ncbi:NTP transferase domain-containing protein [Conexibacter sp. W3-3-2]|uniref:molybdenum cofactor guanylyltransferase n=1 Tax=Conexibacter sp. W3-3-2 TaxID=2675227 RepID=UPI0012B7732C|nr:NTP transferase domain-containing protein [Conexibacter sp. W3-3-2]MTD43901.1 NTP transferase domain-containing protein [Conexibacter sp. W3-3-2]